MATLSDDRIANLLEPYVGHNEVRENLSEWAPKFSQYLDLLLKWNSRTNLTAVREPEEIVTRHFGESVFAASALAELDMNVADLLDFGSGAGFPGLPIQLCLPKLSVCLAESQNRKAAFLRETVRTLKLVTEVWMGRVEDMPAARKFSVVTLRAVDKMDVAMVSAAERVQVGGALLLLSGEGTAIPSGWTVVKHTLIPCSARRFLSVATRSVA